MKDYVGESISANLFRGAESVGGAIHFEEDKLIFKSHKVNIQTGETEILYKDINSIDKTNTLGIIPNGMKITLENEEKYRFVLSNRENVIEFLNSKISSNI